MTMSDSRIPRGDHHNWTSVWTGVCE